ncbi:serine/threonine-protein phosphatase [Actinomadura sp. ATCC 31491]|uniref:Serine/threonine-protein phosphatase n=1 Tax=Actinomadura luzonensis TaxID=2805427 RepID=A0ABT0G2F3_9ACTN|nr:PP2C family protein-serine/threonine phosphatase [Actinomadura luzonensis]MCK2218755.1 serine/threonine-protein phosphatase [Actinomadura luzonensis]
MAEGDTPYPMVVVGASGVVERANAAARSLLGGVPPDARIAPVWLVRAHRGLVAGGPARPVLGPVGERVFEAHPVEVGDAGHVTWWLVDVTARERAAEALRAERDSLAAVVETSSELLSSLNLDRCVEVAARLAARHLADAARVVVPRCGHRYEVACCEAGGEPVRRDLTVDPGTMPGLAEALRGFPPVPARWVDPAEAPGWVTRGAPAGIGSIAVLGLPGHGLSAGALILLRRAEEPGFSPAEELFVPLFTARAGTALSIARLYAEQSAITETLMADLLPPVMSRLDGVEVAARYRAAGDSAQVGGDFYDVHAAAGVGRESLVVLGDVSGKGLEAAVLTGKIRNTLRALLPLADDHQRVLERLNEVLLAGDSPRYVTLVLAGVERRGTRVALRLTSAGHPPPMIVRRDGRVEEARTQGTLIGLLEQVTSVTQEVLLEPGESCLLYSDGVIEARGGPLGDELFGDERLQAELRHCAGMPADALAERVQMLAAQWAGGGEHDDVAIVAVAAPREVLLDVAAADGPP